jgi:hypothetical protein
MIRIRGAEENLSIPKFSTYDPLGSDEKRLQLLKANAILMQHSQNQPRLVVVPSPPTTGYPSPPGTLASGSPIVSRHWKVQECLSSRIGAEYPLQFWDDGCRGLQ